MKAIVIFGKALLAFHANLWEGKGQKRFPRSSKASSC